MKIKLAFLFVLYISSILTAQNSFTRNYDELQKFALTSPGAMKFGLYGYDNPALLSYLHSWDLYFTWSPPKNEITRFNHWGLFTAIPNFGFGLIEQKIGNNTIRDFRISSAYGNKSISVGFQYGWSSGDIDFFNRSNMFSIGTLIRPNRMFSFGLVGISNSAFNNYQTVLDFAVRPFSNEVVTVFADFLFKKNLSLNKAHWSVGAVIEPLNGIRFIARYFDTKSFNFGFDLSLGNFGLNTQSHFNPDNKYLSNSYGLRIGAYDRNILSELIKSENYIKIDLNRQIKYQKYQLLDNSITLYSILQELEAINNDKNAKGIFINTSGMVASREMLWEIRTKLQELKNNGKEIFIYIDIANIDIYHFASVANKILIDPMGIITLEGYLDGRSFYKNALEKVGIAYDEWRFFEYKSAMEIFSKEKMSEKDREQRKKLVDDFYQLARKEITSSRNISNEEFDNLVDDGFIFTASEALNKGLVDSIARWYVEKDFQTGSKNKKKNFISINQVEPLKQPVDNYWSEKPAIAIIYAIGVCAMDQGIKARTLVKDIEAAANNKNIKAIVLRVDSPGGDALASDVIAEALKKLKGKKPIIVSQGSVAASGGYWLSMYADTIVAAPNTVTGSIGVIGGWFYNKNLKEKIGFSTDYVKQGQHADLGFGLTIPILNLTIPDRNLNDSEKIKMELLIKNLYDDFLSRVAIGRNKSKENINKIGQGRVWSGLDALNNGLVDVVGGLETAILIARDKAGIKGNLYQILQYPQMPLIDFGKIFPSPLQIINEENTALELLRFRMKNNGLPLLMAPFDEILDEVFLDALNK